MIGTILHDRWRILAELGRGGMGEVYLAEHITLGRKEAIKILMPSLAADPHFVSRFRREARAVNRLRHPNIIAIYDFGQLVDSRFYLSMEYADGESVYRLLKLAGRFDIPRALHVLGQLAYAVHHAHSRGVVHRDLKPDNLILVGDDETLKVLDFGVAKIVATDHQDSVALSSSNLIWGSPRYMSPERARGIGNDPRSDLYAIGVMAWELIVGLPPFMGGPDEVIRAHLKEKPIPPSAQRALGDVPPELDALILKCMAKKPEERFQSAADVYAAMTKVAGYPSAKTETRRRFVPITRRPAVLDSDTTPLGFDNVRGALRSVAEALIDYGVDETRLVGGVAQLRDREQELAGVEATQDALEHEAAALRETLGDRETSLRFAIGELRYTAKLPDAPPELKTQIRELEARLETVTANRERLRQVEGDIAATAAKRGTALEQVVAAYDVLERAVEDILPAHVGNPALAPLAQRLALVKRRRPTRPQASGPRPPEDPESEP
ncbi:MAG TPA: protein kinase [Kofleriaceae bacterium]